MEHAYIKTIKLTSMMLDNENFRYEPSTSQIEALSKMIKEQGDKLYKLAIDIINNGLNPTDIIIVTPVENGQYRVLEGNRRITTLKLLKTPTLIDENINLRKKFIKIHDKNKENIPSEVRCAIYDNPNDAYIWIRRKHEGQLDGIGTVTWNSQQIQRFHEHNTGKVSPPLQVITFLNNSNIDLKIKERLPEINITNLSRLLSDPDVRTFLGLELKNGELFSKIDTSETIKGLISIIKDILNPSFNVKKIYKKEDRTNYIKNKRNEISIDYSKETPLWNIKKPESELNTKNGETKSEKNTKNDKGERKTLIPKNFNVNIDKPKIWGIFTELKRLDIGKYVFSCSVMFRVLIETSIDEYCDTFDLVPDDKITSAKSGKDLKQKVNRVIQNMTSRMIIDITLSKGIRAEINDDNSILSIDSWNAYVHNANFSPKVDNLITGWDNIQIFFSLLWESINNKNK